MPGFAAAMSRAHGICALAVQLSARGCGVVPSHVPALTIRGLLISGPGALFGVRLLTAGGPCGSAAWADRI
jgi:hypothetical protein